jgi:hypothetical protein
MGNQQVRRLRAGIFGQQNDQASLRLGWAELDGVGFWHRVAIGACPASSEKGLRGGNKDKCEEDLQVSGHRASPFCPLDSGVLSWRK